MGGVDGKRWISARATGVGGKQRGVDSADDDRTFVASSSAGWVAAAASPGGAEEIIVKSCRLCLLGGASILSLLKTPLRMSKKILRNLINFSEFLRMNKIDPENS